MRCIQVLSAVAVLVLASIVFAQTPGAPVAPTRPPATPPFEPPPTSGETAAETGTETVPAKPESELPLATRKTDFYVPFKVPKNSSASELQLYVSSDLGLNWKLYARETPTAGQFRFLAAHDGEYWFYLHTVYVGSNAKAGPFQPQLKVLVDTTSPRLEADAKVDAKNNLRITWKAYDPHLLADSLKFEQYDEQSNKWQPAAELRIDNTEQPATQSLGSAIQTDVGATKRQYRVSIADRSGNVAVVEKMVTPPVRTQADATADATAVNTAPGVQTWRPIQSSDSPGATDSGSPAPPTPLAGRDADPPAADAVADNSADAVSPESPQYQPVASPVRPPVGAQNVGSVWKAPSGERPQMTNQREFQLAYDVKSVGPSGLAKVTLWSTRDGGDTWAVLTTDEDRQSPIDVAVAEDGVYGFVIVLEAGNGLANNPPTAGDMADVWIGVDTINPVGEITSAPYGTGQYAGHLTIKYTVEDAMLADRPISLSFAERPEGPWTLIAGGLENTGEYHWRLDQRIPQYIFLKLAVRDAAGNVAEQILSRPVAVDGLAPKGKITGLAN